MKFFKTIFIWNLIAAVLVFCLCAPSARAGWFSNAVNSVKEAVKDATSEVKDAVQKPAERVLKGKLTGFGVAVVLLAPILTSIVAPMGLGIIGEVIFTAGAIQCGVFGDDNVTFKNCDTASGGGNGKPETVSSDTPTLKEESHNIDGRGSIDSTYEIGGNVEDYGIYRDGNLVSQGSARGLSFITFRDSGLQCHHTYQYVLVMTDSAGQQFQYPQESVYNKCLPECVISANKTKVVFPAQIILSWNCVEADSCSIAPAVGAAAVPSGQKTATPDKDTVYIITCDNIDGSASFSSAVEVLTPERKEVPIY